MKAYQGESLSWQTEDRIVTLSLHRAPANEIGSPMLAELERFAVALDALGECADVVIIQSTLPSGFSAGADLRELYVRMMEVPVSERQTGVRDFLDRVHAVLDRIDQSGLTTIAATHGVCFGGGFELALVCDLIIADKLTRYCFPELRLGLIPGFGGIPRLKRDLGNALVRDLLLTGRSISAARALAVGLVSQVVSEGKSLAAAQSTARQITKFDPVTRSTAKRFIKPIPRADLRREIDIFCDLLVRPAVEAGLRRFVESTDPYPYLP